MTMRIAHLTDIHFQSDPTFNDLQHLKRLMGSTNLYLFGRKSKFSLDSQRKSIQKIVDLKPDLVIITGDLTAQALKPEFEMARQELDPILSRFPTVIQAGNHDTYIHPHPPIMRSLFNQWLMAKGADYRSFQEVGVLCVESCQPSLLSQGFVDPENLKKANELLTHKYEPFIFFCMHYPLLNRHGEPYGPQTRAIKNAPIVLDWLKTQSKIHAYLHGHEHHGYRTEISIQDATIPSLNPGVSGYAIDAKRQRFPHVGLYTVHQGRLVNVERFCLKGEVFEKEPHPAFSSKL